MKILVITQYFWPEEFRINDICEGLVKDGHEVEVLTGLPNYPKGKIYEGYSVKGPYREEYNGIKVRRFPVIPRGNSSSVMMLLNYLSYMVVGSIRVLPILFKKYDRVFMFQTSPITAAVPAIIYSRVKKVPSCIYVQDLWPETFYTIVPIKNDKVRKRFKRICISMYNKFSTILISSRGFGDILVDGGINKDKIVYFPQWAEDLYGEMEENNDFLGNKNEFIVTFAGNIGKAQSVDTIIKAANLAKGNCKIKWRILGDGSELNNIKELVKKYKLEDRVELLGRKPVTDMPKYFAVSDGLIVTLKNEGILKVTLPAKVQSYMASSKPIIAAVSGEGGKVIKEANCGLSGEAEDYEVLYKNVLKLYNMNEKERKQLGNNGKEYFDNNFTREKLLNQLNHIIKEMMF